MASEAPQNPYEFTREAYDLLVRESPNCQLSRRSKFEEMELVDDCTLFDIYRQPRAPVTAPQATRTLPVRVLNADLTCPICLGIIKETRVVMECLHRFCGECISTAIRHSKRECPSCRIHIPSKRSLRPDANFDALIRKIHPNLAEFEKNEDEIIQQLNRSRHFHNAYTESTRMGVISQAASRRHGGRKKTVEGSTSVAVSASSSRAASPSETPNGASQPVGEKRRSPDRSPPNDSNSSSAAVSEDESARKKPRVSTTAEPTSAATESTSSSAETTPVSTPSSVPVPGKVNLRVLLHEEEEQNAPKLKRTLFTTSSKLKIRHLKKHLCNLLNLDSYKNMCIVLPNVNCKLSGLGHQGVRQDLRCDQELQDFVTVKDIYQQYGMGTAWELRLLYHFSPGTIVNGLAQFVSSSV